MESLTLEKFADLKLPTGQLRNQIGGSGKQSNRSETCETGGVFQKDSQTDVYTDNECGEWSHSCSTVVYLQNSLGTCSQESESWCS
jgi:hypothetical protein